MYNNQIEKNILYEDKEILVCRKPSGMPVQAAEIGTMDMESALKNYLAQKNTGKNAISGEWSIALISR